MLFISSRYFCSRPTAYCHLLPAHSVYIGYFYRQERDSGNHRLLAFGSNIHHAATFHFDVYFASVWKSDWRCEQYAHSRGFCTWINDTAAFLFGSLFGKHRLIERISPKKSVEGFVSGILICIIATLIAAPYFPTISIYLWVAIGLITPVFASLGDLFESLLKRTYGVKDSGNIIPGHGGILDRIDSLLVVFPTIYLFLLFCSAFGVL